MASAYPLPALPPPNSGAPEAAAAARRPGRRHRALRRRPPLRPALPLPNSGAPDGATEPSDGALLSAAGGKRLHYNLPGDNFPVNTEVTSNLSSHAVLKKEKRGLIQERLKQSPNSGLGSLHGTSLPIAGETSMILNHPLGIKMENWRAPSDLSRTNARVKIIQQHPTVLKCCCCGCGEGIEAEPENSADGSAATLAVVGRKK